MVKAGGLARFGLVPSCGLKRRFGGGRLVQFRRVNECSGDDRWPWGKSNALLNHGEVLFPARGHVAFIRCWSTAEGGRWPCRTSRPDVAVTHLT